MKKPFGIMLISVIEIMKGATGLFFSFFYIHFKEKPVLYFICLSLCICKLAIGFGLWQLQEWARQLIVAILILVLPVFVVFYVTKILSGYAHLLLILLFMLTITYLVYLTSPRMKAIFKIKQEQGS